MRYLILVMSIAILAGCATATTSERPRVFYDRKYNTYYQLRSDQGETKAPRTTSYYDRKNNTYLPVRDASRRES